ncbi:hypothetical protein K466DRAFT_606231 [Polyporus arcularius HHB13444]|uniref:GST N-terminal domain-containing protein n=1 Tax=Polyporus arcularius HHB13444 TaxID=1314778 RepID=A0A5C3NQJ7_9APHY|nr:hypothetical protein K466DRAFT_606231 [Polyporus arcularius HHB13444]
MPAAKRLTLYYAADTPFPHRVRLALEEAGAKYDLILIELSNKPDWYAKKVYPLAKVPVLVYGGPALHEDEAPSPEAATITESSVILEFLADLFPDLLPADPVLRAKARFFIKTVDEKFSKAFFKFVLFGGSMDEMLDAVVEMQALLPDTGFAVGAWSIADTAFAPFLVRLESLLRNNFCTFADGVAEKTLTELRAPTFARIWRYLEENVARESMAKTWDETDALAEINRRVVSIQSAAQNNQ